MWSGPRPMYSDYRNLPSDNGPCRQVCHVVGGTAMCSCFPGYAIMADGVSCEGEYPGDHPLTFADQVVLCEGLG